MVLLSANGYGRDTPTEEERVTTSPGQVAGATQQAAGQTATTAKDEATQVGQVAASAASDVAGTAKQQAGQVAGEAVNQLRSLTDEARNQANQQVSNATDKLSSTVRSLASEMRDLGQGKGDASGTVAGLVQQLADKSEQLADYVSAQGPGGLLQELRTFASRKPGTFLLGALAAGAVTGRVVKGATAGSSTGAVGTSPRSLTSGSTGAYGTTDTYGTASTHETSSYGTASARPVAAAGDTVPSSEPMPPEFTSSATGVGSGDIPVAHSDDSGILDDDVTVIGPVSGDDRLRAEGLETTPYDEGGHGGTSQQGTGLR